MSRSKSKRLFQSINRARQRTKQTKNKEQMLQFIHVLNKNFFKYKRTSVHLQDGQSHLRDCVNAPLTELTQIKFIQLQFKNFQSFTVHFARVQYIPYESDTISKEKMAAVEATSLNVYFKVMNTSLHMVKHNERRTINIQ